MSKKYYFKLLNVVRNHNHNYNCHFFIMQMLVPQEEASMKREPNINPVPRDLTNCGLFRSRDFEQCRQVCVTHDAYNMHKGEFISKSFMIQLDLQYERHKYTNFNIMHISLHNESSNG